MRGFVHSEQVYVGSKHPEDRIVVSRNEQVNGIFVSAILLIRVDHKHRGVNKWAQVKTRTVHKVQLSGWRIG